MIYLSCELPFLEALQRNISKAIGGEMPICPWRMQSPLQTNNYNVAMMVRSQSRLCIISKSTAVGFFFAFGLLRAVSAAYGSSQARGQIGATAAGLQHSPCHARSSRVCDLHHSSRQCQIPDPLSEARDRTRILMDTSQVCHP